MLKYCVEQWDKNKKLLESVLNERKEILCTYKYIATERNLNRKKINQLNRCQIYQ